MELSSYDISIFIWGVRMNLINKLMNEIERIKGQRYQILIIPPNNENRTSLTQALEQLNVPLLNLSLILAKHLKEIPPKKRPLAAGAILRQVIGKVSSEIVCLEKIEYLFDPELNQDPLRLLANMSGNKVIIVFWPGEVKENRLLYATLGHPDFYENDNYVHHIVQL